jgi:CRISPR-associated exonuclease Cas4
MIRVSDITVYLKCPRMAYFMNKGNELVKDITLAYIEKIILKELALSYPDAPDNEDMVSFLDGELDRLSDELRVIYRPELAGIDDELITDSISNVRAMLGNICPNLAGNRDFYAADPFNTGEVLQSGKFGLAGTPDKLVKINDEIIPSIIKTGNMPENGVWKSDRLQLTAYAILVEEMYGTIVERGFVEYARFGKVREVKLKRHERRKVLQVRDKIKKTMDGIMPEKPQDAPCEYCGFVDMCDVKSTLASRFF